MGFADFIPLLVIITILILVGRHSRSRAKKAAQLKDSIYGAAGAHSQNDAIWNPNAAVNWSVLLTPAFGSYLHMLNWKALGQPERAATSKKWFYASLAILVIYLLMLVFMLEAADSAIRALGFLYVIVWYSFVGNSQGIFVKVKFGSNYSKKPWGRALLIGISALIGYYVLALIVVLTSSH